MPSEPSPYASLLRNELCARNASYAVHEQLPHVTSHGANPVQTQLSFVRHLRVGRSTEISFLPATVPFYAGRNGGDDSIEWIAKPSAHYRKAIALTLE